MEFHSHANWAASDVRTLHRTHPSDLQRFKNSRASGRSMTISSFIGRAAPSQCAQSQFLVIRRSHYLWGCRSIAHVRLCRLLPRRDAQLLRREIIVKQFAQTGWDCEMGQANEREGGNPE